MNCLKGIKLVGKCKQIESVTCSSAWVIQDLAQDWVHLLFESTDMVPLARRIHQDMWQKRAAIVPLWRLRCAWSKQQTVQVVGCCVAAISASGPSLSPLGSISFESLPCARAQYEAWEELWDILTLKSSISMEEKCAEPRIRMMRWA
jgi:hypothetical protein